MQTLRTPGDARGATRTLPPKGGRRRDFLTPRLRGRARGLLVLLSIVALLLVVVQTAAARVANSSRIGNISIDCETVIFGFTDFPPGTAQIDYAIRVDGTPTHSGTFDLTGPTGGRVIANHVEGHHTVSASASWSADGRAEESRTLACEQPPPPPPPTTPPPPPPPSSPPPPAPQVDAPPASETETPPASRLLPPLEVDDLVVTPPAPRARRCKAHQRTVNHKCVPAAVKKPKSVKPAVKTKHKGVFSAKKTKLLPFTK